MAKQRSKQALLREQEGNQVVDVFFAQEKSEVRPHIVVEAIHHIGGWLQDRLPQIFHRGQSWHAVAGALGDSLE